MTSILDRPQAEQLRGVAIFLVVLGHLWVHASKQSPFLMLQGDAVAMFLIISVFGLTMSSMGKN